MKTLVTVFYNTNVVHPCCNLKSHLRPDIPYLLKPLSPLRPNIEHLFQPLSPLRPDIPHLLQPQSLLRPQSPQSPLHSVPVPSWRLLSHAPVSTTSAPPFTTHALVTTTPDALLYHSVPTSTTPATTPTTPAPTPPSPAPSSIYPKPYSRHAQQDCLLIILALGDKVPP